MIRVFDLIGWVLIGLFMMLFSVCLSVYILNVLFGASGIYRTCPNDDDNYCLVIQQFPKIIILNILLPTDAILLAYTSTHNPPQIKSFPY